MGLIHTANCANYELLRENARTNRKNLTDAERLLWFHLVHDLSDYKFRRQHIIGDYIVDFVCLRSLIVIEVDGSYHLKQEQQRSDEERTKYLNEKGFKVLRFTNEQIFTDIVNVIKEINQNLHSPSPEVTSPSSTPTTSPYRGLGGSQKSSIGLTHPPSGGLGASEIMAPVGSRDSLMAAVQAKADSVYFGVEQLNMRAHSANHFTLDDLRFIAETCHEHGMKSYLTVNTIVYGEELNTMHTIIDAAVEAGVSAVIASDVAVMVYCRQVGMEVHLSTQLNISNIEALKFYAQFADVVVLARELRLDQVAEIRRQVVEQNICGPCGELIRIEMFCHGALCMAISGKCYMSLDNTSRSANRGECMQICRRSYLLTDAETGTQLEVDNKYIMSPKDLKTIRFIDRMAESGVEVFKIEGRARGPEYVYTVVSCYREALQAIADGTFTEEKKDEWDSRLATVFNRGFWDGYYLGQRLGEWNSNYGSNATERKVYIGKGLKYFSRLGVGEFTCDAAEFSVGDRLLVTGPTTGVMYLTATEIHDDTTAAVQTARKGTRVAIPVTAKIRPSDKLFKLEKV